MKRLNFQKLIAIVFLFTSHSISAQIGNGFESVVGQTLNDACLYLDDDNTTIHQLQNYNATCGIITVLVPGTGSVLGFENILDPSGPNGNAGFTDGDAFGVINNAGLSSQAGISAPEGVQAFIMEDVDGNIEMKFDWVDLIGTSCPTANLQYFLEGTSWETADFLYVHIDIANCTEATTLSLIDTRGLDIDDLGIEESWNTLSQDLSSYVSCSAQLIIEFSSNSSSEELFIDNVQFSQGTALPIELVSFDARQIQEENAIALNWETALELNNEGFKVQHSTNGKNWKEIAFKDGIGNSTKTAKYEYIDYHPSSGYNYYRLKQIDFDGRHSFSNVVAIDYLNASEDAITIFPNPVDNVVHLSSSKSNNEDTSIELISSNGQILIKKNFSNNDSQMSLELSSFPKGLYFLNIWTGGTWIVKKIIKK